MDKQDKQIEEKLLQLESAVIKESELHPNMPASQLPPNQLPKGNLVESEAPSKVVGSDLYYFSGLGLIFLGILLVFQHVRVGTGFFALLGLGNGGFGLLLLPLLIGIGWMIYDSKNKIAWAVTALSCLVIFFAVLSSLVMTFPTLSLLNLITILLPLVCGGAFLLKGLGGPKGLEERLRQEKLIK